MSGTARRALGLFAAFLAVACLYAALLGGFRQEFLSDASIHYVTTALAHDYLVHGLPQNPLTYLVDYYRHYPLAGFGLWPPLYYAVSGLWAVPFGTSRVSMEMLSAVIAAGCSTTLAATLWRRAGGPAAAFGGLLLLLMPAQSSALRTLLLDPLCGLACFAAALAFARYLKRGTTRAALLFVAAALAAIFTKGNALLLGLLPILAIALTGRWAVLHDWRLWLSGALVGAISAPWYLFTAGFAAQGFRYHWGVEFFLGAIPANLVFLFENFGPLVLALAAVGAWLRCRPGAGPDALWWRTMAALALACLLFQSIVPAALNLRYLFTAFFPIAAFAAAGLTSAVRAARPAIGIAALASVAILGFRQPELSSLGVAPLAQAAAAAAAPGTPVLVVGSGLFEAGAIAELAAADRVRPSLYALRASRLLGGGGYFATDYQPRYATAAAAGAAIDRVAPPLVMLELSGAARKWRHVAQVEALAAGQPKRWRRIAAFPGAPGRSYALYRLVGRKPNVALVEALNDNPVLSGLAHAAPPQQ